LTLKDVIEYIYYNKFKFNWANVRVIFTNDNSYFGKVNLEEGIMYISLYWLKRVDDKEKYKILNHEIEHFNQYQEINLDDYDIEELEKLAYQKEDII